jgi:hypothetical protein
MTDVAYLCHNCGSVHEVESIRENLILDLRAAASYGLAGQRGMPDPSARFLRWRMAWGLAQALWPGYSHHRRLAWARRLVQGRPRPYPIGLFPAERQLAALRAQVTRLRRHRMAGWPVSASASPPALGQDHDRPV